jgi:hypothetical protein
MREPSDAAITAQRIVNEMVKGFVFQDHELSVTCSLGIIMGIVSRICSWKSSLRPQGDTGFPEFCNCAIPGTKDQSREIL